MIFFEFIISLRITIILIKTRRPQDFKVESGFLVRLC